MSAATSAEGYVYDDGGRDGTRCVYGYFTGPPVGDETTTAVAELEEWARLCRYTLSDDEGNSRPCNSDAAWSSTRSPGPFA
jgi:hypothetical protein